MPLVSHKIPATRWRAPGPWSVRPIALVPLWGGLAAFGFGEGLLVVAGWGATPWTVFAQGVAIQTGWTVGWTTGFISLAVLLLWWPLRERPGFGTISNVVIIALVLGLTVTIVPQSSVSWVRAIEVAGAIESIGMGSAWYLTTGLGPGPRDGLMTSLHRKFNISVVYVRSVIEGTVLIIGWLLGGTFGVATVLFALTVGVAIGVNLQLVARLSSVLS